MARDTGPRIERKIESGHDLEPQTVYKGSQAQRQASLWWQLPAAAGGSAPESDRPHRPLFTLVDRLKEEQRPRFDRIDRYMRLYGGRNFTRLDAKNYFREAPAAQDQLVSFNGIQSVVDTVMSKVAKNKPVPQFLTEGGQFDERMRAKKMTRYVTGVFHDQAVYKQGRYVTQSAAILGDGYFYPYRMGDRVAVEWVFPKELLIDPVEAFFGQPGNIYRDKNVPRHKLLAMFPKHQTKILAAPSVEDTGSDTTLDHVRVVEAWHLASGPEAEDGRHVLAIEGETLLDEVYKRHYEPFVKLHWSDPLIGWHGRGLSEELQGLQVEANRLLIKIQKTFHLAAVPWVLTPSGANISTADIRNEIGLVLRYHGAVPPRITTHQTVHPEVFSHLERLVRMMYEKAGISQMSASAKKPPGLESGIALREYHDIETERLVLFAQAHEQMYLELARRVIDLSREIAKQTGLKEGQPGMSVRSPGRRYFDMIKWEDVDLNDERYIMQVFPISSLPSSPAGRKDEVLDLLEAGFLDMPTAMQLLDFPDLSAEKQIQLAAIENIDWTIAEMLESGRYHPPESMQDLTLGLQRVNSAYLMARTDGAPEARLNMMRRWLTTAEAMLAAAAEPQAPVPPEPAAPALPAGLPAEMVPPAAA